VVFREKNCEENERSFIESVKASKIKVVGVVEIIKLTTKQTFIQK